MRLWHDHSVLSVLSMIVRDLFNAIKTAFLALPPDRRTAQWQAEARSRAVADEKGVALKEHLSPAS